MCPTTLMRGVDRPGLFERDPDQDGTTRSRSSVSLRGMPKFVMLSTLGPDGSARLSENPERLREVSSEVEAMGVKVLAQYALLGNWDFLNILEAPDEKTMMKVATTLAARGTLKTLTMAAVEVEEFISTLKG